MEEWVKVFESVGRHHEHEFISVEDLKIDGEKEAICMICGEPSSIPYLKCSSCNYHCHESCHDLTGEIEHPLHPIHSLHWAMPNRTRFCHTCGKDCGKSFFYACNDCNFSLHIKCSSLRPANKDDGHQHEFVRFLKDSQFTCELCGEDGKDLICVCSICYLLVHAGCAWFSDTIRIILHPHSLVLTYSVPQVVEQAATVCKLCSLKLNTEYAAYYCQQCNYATHLMCARDYQLLEDGKAFDDSAPVEINQWFSQGFVNGLIKDINSEVRERSLPPKIKHFSHQHDLTLSYEETSDDQVCEGCMQLITIPFYSCKDCNFSLHYLCTKLPRSFRCLWPWPATCDLMVHIPSFDGTFKCNMCRRRRHGFAYRLRSRYNGLLDIQCSIFQERFRHECHPHSFLVRDLIDPCQRLMCESCGNGGFLKCSHCRFSICHRCSSFPIEATHRYDKHILKLTYTVEDEFEENYCLICEKKKNQKKWFYYCAICDFSAHVKCVIGRYPYIKFGKTYNDKNHQHPLTFIQKIEDSSPCDVCNKPFNGVALHCKECKLNIHPRFEFDCLGEEEEEEVVEEEEEEEEVEEGEEEEEEVEEGEEEEEEEEEEEKREKKKKERSDCLGEEPRVELKEKEEEEEKEEEGNELQRKSEN